jgi:hypothetical protein
MRCWRGVLFLALLGVACTDARKSGSARDLRTEPWTETEVAQILGEVRRHFIAPRDSIFRPRLEERRVVLDWAETLRAFGMPADRDPGRFGLHDVDVGSAALLSDCRSLQLDASCDQLGWDIFLSVQPQSVSVTEALVHVSVGVAGRPGVSFVKGEKPPRGSRATLSMRRWDMFLRRDRYGAWKFHRRGGFLIGTNERHSAKAVVS